MVTFKYPKPSGCYKARVQSKGPDLQNYRDGKWNKASRAKYMGNHQTKSSI